MIQASEPRFVFDFFASRLGLHWSNDFRGVLWVPDECRGDVMRMSDVAIAVAYNAFIGRTCCIHTVIQRPEKLTREVLRESFGYPFERAGCEALLGLVDSKNDAALDFDKRLGFQEIARIPDGGPEGDLVVLRMQRHECRWLRPH